MGVADRLKHAWNAFVDNEQNPPIFSGWGHAASSGVRPDRPRFSFTNERSIISSIYTRMGIDASGVAIRHVRLDENQHFLSDVKSGLQYCLTVEANIDQAARAFRQDIFMSLFERGVVAIVPTNTTLNPKNTGSYEILTMRVGRVVQWYPQHVRVDLYDDRYGVHKEVVVEKRNVAIVENPLYSVMNEPNSTLQRLLRKLSLLDAVDEASSSGKLDLIIQIPYVVKSQARKEQAEQRAKDIEFQLKGSKYGIAYTDGTEKITQLNRPAENNMLRQVEFLTGMLYSQLGLTEAVFNGTADEKQMLNYHNRTIEPLLTAVVEAMRRSFLTRTARSQNQSVEFFRDPFTLVSIADIAELADKLTRNEILSSNEIRGVIGFKPADDPKADELRNKNLPIVPETEPTPSEST